ncbi:hypothetical protein DIJ64_14600 [Mycobacterium leprae]|uniref:Uncharacterized protein n=1 Tax=Mycobacterium leprae TaxID=1769 RepID=A0AAD0KSJ2_MYCLR|nr:hypothetical protein [Mycobacterium leprae]AWV48853.1 hypothetical protein DIJ64_14600 [Mycobacterium leprae]OAR21240.1 hypothetical protein A8144_07240 [Mycobacterium leprae 3125609]OAX71370.1 hypothetical protein A3216_06260 [Mycobacterium leprae 7935681]
MDTRPGLCTGHATYWPDNEELAEQLNGNTRLGKMWRCLGCTEFTLDEPHGLDHRENAPMIMRGNGKVLRQDVTNRTPAVERLFRSCYQASSGCYVEIL